MWLTNGCWISFVTNQWSSLKPKGNHFQNHKEVLEQNMSAIIVGFKDTPDQIVISLEHWRMQVIIGQEDQEMTKGIGLLSNQEAEMVIPEWWMWWKWLVHSPPTWKVSPKGLKALTLVPNPIRISPQTHVTWGWRRVLMHKHYNISMHQFFLCFVTMLGCVLFASLSWNFFLLVFPF